MTFYVTILAKKKDILCDKLCISDLHSKFKVRARPKKKLDGFGLNLGRNFSY